MNAVGFRGACGSCGLEHLHLLGDILQLLGCYGEDLSECDLAIKRVIAPLVVETDEALLNLLCQNSPPILRCEIQLLFSFKYVCFELRVDGHDEVNGSDRRWWIRVREVNLMMFHHVAEIH